jgi:hypothetical protein
VPVPTLEIELKPSRIYGCGLCVLHLSTYLVLFAVVLPRTLHALVAVLAVLLSLRSWHHWRNLTLWRRLIVRDDQIQLLGERQACNAVLATGTLQAAWLVILPLHLRPGRLWLPILPDSVSNGDWRRLRTWLNSGVRKAKH